MFLDLISLSPKDTGEFYVLNYGESLVSLSGRIPIRPFGSVMTEKENLEKGNAYQKSLKKLALLKEVLINQTYLAVGINENENVLSHVVIVGGTNLDMNPDLATVCLWTDHLAFKVSFS